MDVISRQPSTETHSADVWIVRASSSGVTYKVVVAGPGPLPDGVRLPLAFGLDGDLCGGANISAARSNVGGQDQSPLFVANIGYPIEAGPQAWMMNRVRDLSPFPRPEWEGAIADMMAGAPPTGGGAAFLNFIVDELKPALTEAYPIAPGPVGILGASMAGSFVLYALAQTPAQFDRVLCVSPALFWGGQELKELISRFVADPAPSTAKLFACAGDLETAAHFRAWVQSFPEPLRGASQAFFAAAAGGEVDLLAAAYEAATLFSAREGLATKVMTMANEHHGSVYAPALSQGLRWLYSLS